MANAPREQNASNQTAQPPAWVIEHLISLSEFADSKGLSAFSEKLLDAAETFLGELNKGASAPCKLVAYDTDTNVILFAAARRAPGGLT